MFWFIIIVIGIIILVSASSASGAKQAASTVQSMAEMVGNESRFREYWRFLHAEMIGGQLSQEAEEQIVQRHLADYLNLVAQFKTVTPDNVKVIVPALAKQSDDREILIASEISPQFGKLMQSKRKRERAQSKYAKNVLGLKL